MSEALISVVIPAHNAEKTVTACLESILRQDWKALQIVVVDDGSTDRTAELVSAMAQRDPRIELIRQKNGGVSSARNAGLRQCRGEYIRFTDSDDVMAENSLRTLVDTMERTDSDLVIGAYTEVLGRYRTRRSLVKEPRTLEMDAVLRDLDRYAITFYYSVLWNKLFRRESLERQGISFNEALDWGEDFCFVMNYLREARRVSYVTDLVYEYNRRADGLIMKQFWSSVCHPWANIKKKLTMYDNLKQLFIHRGVYPEYRRRLWMFLFRFSFGK